MPTTGLDISGKSGDCEFELEITELKSASGTPGVRVIFEDTVDAFTTSVPVHEETFVGPITSSIVRTIKSDMAPGLRLGVTSAKLRINVVQLDGGTPSCTLRAALWN